MRTGQTRSVAGSVFINYRLDTAGWSVALDETLSRRYGRDHVFRASRSIRPGEDFPDRIIQGIRESAVVLPLIGPGWLARDARGRRRVDEPGDWVRQEITAALTAGIALIPVVVDGAPFPTASELPGEIAPLGRRQYLRLHHRSATTDIRRIVDTISPILMRTHRVGTPLRGAE